MEPQDDPEARIRELERPLTDQAYTSELGGSHAYPPPPITDGISFGPTRARSSGRVWWIVGLAIILGVVALVVGIMVYVGNVFSSSTSSFTTTPGMFGGDGSFTTGPSSRPAGPPTSVAPLGGKVYVAGVAKSETIECNDSYVSVSGMSNTVVLTGHCSNVSVSGVKNLVTVDDVDTISASGVENRVTYRSGSPVISNAGSGNVVEQG